jgi:hypothetical protein
MTRPLSAYIFFIKDKRKSIVAENPNKKPTEIMSLLGKLWKDLPENEKEKYNKLAASDKANKPAKVKTVKPKKTLSGYFKFAAEHRAQVMQENKGIKFGDIGKKLGKMWKALSDEAKKSYK